MITPEITTVLNLIRIGLGYAEPSSFQLPKDLDWKKAIDFAKSQGVSAIFSDGFLLLPIESMPDIITKMRIIGFGSKCEKEYDKKLLITRPLLKQWHEAGLRVFFLKGMAFARYYPNPKHRNSCDMDVFLTDGMSHPSSDHHPSSTAQRGDEIAQNLGAIVQTDIQKHSQIYIEDILIENHTACCGQLEDKSIAALEAYLENLLQEEQSRAVADTDYLLPPLMFDALFFLYHARTHFIIEEGIQLRHVLDWIVIRQELNKNHKREELNTLSARFGLSKFLDAIDGVASYILSPHQPNTLTHSQHLMLEEILFPSPPPPSTSPRTIFKRRLGVIKEIYHNRWKYPLYSDTTFHHMICIYLKGYLRRFL